MCVCAGNLQHASLVRGKVDAIKDPIIHGLCIRCLDEFETSVTPKLLSGCRRSWIHGDLNDRVCVCVCVCKYVCLYMCVCMYMCMYCCIHTCVLVCACACVCCTRPTLLKNSV